MIEMTTAYGLTFMVPAADKAIGRCLREYGEFARPEVEFIQEFVGGGCFIDVGANIGSIAIPVAAKGNKVIAYEANRGLHGVLAANALLNNLPNLNAIHSAVGETLRLAKFPMMPLSAEANLGTSGFHLAGTYPEEVVAMVTLDVIAPNDTTFVKIDVEGYERQVMRGAQRLLKQVRPIWLFEAAHGDTPANRAMISLFEAEGYSLFWFFAPFVTPRSERQGPPDKLRGDVNIAAFPRAGMNTWPMIPVQVDGHWPVEVADFPYLARFGF